MSNISERMASGRIRFKRGWNNRPVGSTATVAAFGFGLCQTLVDCGKAEWLEEAKATPLAPVSTPEAAPKAEASGDGHARRRK